MKIAAGMILGILVGVACRWFDIPVPSPRSSSVHCSS